MLFNDITKREHFAKDFVEEIYMIQRTGKEECSVRECSISPCTFELKSKWFTPRGTGHSIYSINYKNRYKNLIGRDQEHGHSTLIFNNDKNLGGVELEDEKKKFWVNKSAKIKQCSVLKDLIFNKHDKLIIPPNLVEKIRKYRSKSSSHSIIVAKNKVLGPLKPVQKNKGKHYLKPTIFSSNKNIFNFQKEEKEDDKNEIKNRNIGGFLVIKPKQRSRNHKIFNDKI